MPAHADSQKPENIIYTNAAPAPEPSVTNVFHATHKASTRLSMRCMDLFELATESHQACG